MCAGVRECIWSVRLRCRERSYLWIFISKRIPRSHRNSHCVYDVDAVHKHTRSYDYYVLALAVRSASADV